MENKALKTRIGQIHARQILDSRGRPTIEVDVRLRGGSCGRASVPSGASTGSAEALELRDGDPDHYSGLGVLRAVKNVNGEIARAVIGHDALEQAALDSLLRELDATPQLARLGANAILGVSLAACRAAAAAKEQMLFQHISELTGNRPLLPLPMVNILSGGRHAAGGMDFQDFLAIPVGAATLEDAIHQVAQVRTAATSVAERRGLPTLLADEGGLSPGFPSARQALQMMVEAIERACLRPKDDIAIAIDVAATVLRSPQGGYTLKREGRELGSFEMIEELVALTTEFPIVSLEDALDEEDWSGWQNLTKRLGGRVQLIGDDLFATNSSRLDRGIATAVGNGVLVKANQNGTLSGALDVIDQAKKAGYATIVSARSGETEDSFLADLAVGSAAGQIKIGSLRTSSTVAKYNQLLRIGETGQCLYAGRGALAAQS